MFRPLTSGCPYSTACSTTPSPGSDSPNKAECEEKSQPGTEALLCSMEEIRNDVISDKFSVVDNCDSFSDIQGSILWPRRSYMYRVSFLSMMPAFGFFVFGFSCPFWMKKYQVAKHRGHYNQIDRVDVSIGLWRVCQGLDFIDLADCTTLPDISSNTMACQAMLCLCFIFTLFSLVFGLYENCATRYDMDERGDVRTRRPEVNAIVAGIFGMVGVSLYGVIIIDVARDGEGGVHWAFPLTACAVTALTICGILMAISNRIHSTPPMSYSGQVIGLSCQNAGAGRDIGMQDRLVTPAHTMTSPPPPNGGPTTPPTYGFNTDIVSPPPPHPPPNNPTDLSFVERSDSAYASAHMSSPDLFTSSLTLDGSQTNQQTHVVETYDLYTRPGDPVKKQILKRQLDSKAAQRRSWHFDDKQGAYVVSDLINNPLGSTTLPSETTKRKEGIKPPVPPRRDKIVTSSNRPQNRLQTISDEGNDLMVLEDPVVTIPESSSTNSDQSEVFRGDPKSVMKRNTNPFLDDVVVVVPGPPPTTTGVGSESDTIDSWHSQPWPEPPTESEILGEHLNSEENNQNHEKEYNRIRQGSKSNDVPESLQYQPQHFGTLSRKPSSGKRHETRQQPSHDPGGLDTQQRRGSNERRPGSRKGRGPPVEQNHHQNRSDVKVPIMKEYDNPLFKRQPSPRREMTTCEKNSVVSPPAPPVYDSTSFIHPAPLTSQPPSHYATTTDSFHRNSPAHTTYGVPNDSETTVRRQTTGHYDSVNQTPQNRKHGVPHNKKPNVQPKSSPKTKPKPIEKSRPRQVKREHNQRRTGANDSPIPASPPPGYYSSNPDVSRQSPRASPRVPRRRPESMGRDDVRSCDNRNIYQQTSGNSRQSPFYPNHSPWDSDL